MVRGKVFRKIGLFIIRERLTGKELAIRMTPGRARKSDNTES